MHIQRIKRLCIIFGEVFIFYIRDDIECCFLPKLPWGCIIFRTFKCYSFFSNFDDVFLSVNRAFSLKLCYFITNNVKCQHLFNFIKISFYFYHMRSVINTSCLGGTAFSEKKSSTNLMTKLLSLNKMNISFQK